MGPFKIKRQNTQNTFEIDIPAAVRKKMRPVFHSSELIPFETRELDPICALPPRDGADNPDLLPEEEQELEHALRVPGDNPAGNHPQPSGVDQAFGDVPPADGAAVDQSFDQAAQQQWDLNCVTVDDPWVVYSFQTMAFKKMRMRSTCHS